VLLAIQFGKMFGRRGVAFASSKKVGQEKKLSAEAHRKSFRALESAVVSRRTGKGLLKSGSVPDKGAK